MFLRHQHTALPYPFPVVTHIEHRSDFRPCFISFQHWRHQSNFLVVLVLFCLFFFLSKKKARDWNVEKLPIITRRNTCCWLHGGMRCSGAHERRRRHFFFFRGDYFFSPSSSSSSSSSSGINNVLLSNSKWCVPLTNNCHARPDRNEVRGVLPRSAYTISLFLFSFCLSKKANCYVSFPSTSKLPFRDRSFVTHGQSVVDRNRDKRTW